MIKKRRVKFGWGGKGMKSRDNICVMQVKNTFIQSIVSANVL